MMRADRPEPHRPPPTWTDATGPQGAALIAELQRLQSALDHDHQDTTPWHVGDERTMPIGQPSPARRHGRTSAAGAGPGSEVGVLRTALDVCLGVFGFGVQARARKAIHASEDDRIRAQMHELRMRLRQHDGDGHVPARAAAADDRERSPGRSNVLPWPLAALWTDTSGPRDRFVDRVRGACGFLAGGVPAAETPGTAFAARTERAIAGELRTGLRVLMASVGILGGWATLVPLSGAIVVPGVLVVESNLKKVQHPTGGIVAQIPVRDGAHVKAGDLVLRLDETQARANHQVLTAQLDQVRVRIARLVAERDGTGAPRVPRELEARLAEPDLKQLWASETALFAGRDAARRSARDLLASRVSQLGEQILGLDAQVKSRLAQRDLIAGELEGVSGLFEKGLVPLTRKTALQRDAARLDGEYGQAIAAIAEAKAKVSETELQILRADQDFRTEVMKDLREAQDKERELIEKTVAARDLLTRIDLRAPTTGIVHQLAVHTVGGVIAAGEVVMEIVPDSDELQIEAKLPPQDIDHVKPGQTSFVRFPAFNQRTTPELVGHVSYIAADLSTDPKTNATAYLVRITLSDDERRRLHGLQLVSGMPAEVFLQTGARTMMSYLVKPISDQLQRMFNEP